MFYFSLIDLFKGEKVWFVSFHNIKPEQVAGTGDQLATVPSAFSSCGQWYEALALARVSPCNHIILHIESVISMIQSYHPTYLVREKA